VQHANSCPWRISGSNCHQDARRNHTLDSRKGTGSTLQPVSHARHPRSHSRWHANLPPRTAA
jgi:hypothetical protein